MRILSEKDILEILYGSTFLGSGGGGSLADALVMLEENVKKRGKVEVEMISHEEMEDGTCAVVIAGMGAPTVLKEKEEKFRYEAGYAFTAMENLARYAGKSISAVIPVEYGAVNCFVPMIACMEKGVPLVDADGCGRAVPGLDSTLFDIYGIPFSPAVITDEGGDVIVILPKDAADGKASENLCRHMCVAYNYIVGLGGWLSSKEDIKSKLVCGSLSYAQKIGAVILEAKKKGANLKSAIEKAVECRLLVDGKIIGYENEMKDGHDIGIVTVENESGKYFVDLKNESLIFRDGKKPLITCPDLICAIDKDSYTPLTNADIKVGMNVLYFAVPAPEIWFANPRGSDCWKPYLDVLGHKNGIVRY